VNPPKVDELDYIQTLIAAQKIFSAVEASKVHPDERGGIASRLHAAAATSSAR
jgi:hypothetical protein